MAGSNNILNLPIPVPVNKGGTGSSSFGFNHGLIVAGSSSTAPLTAIEAGPSGYVLTSSGSVAAPGWSAYVYGLQYIDEGSATTGDGQPNSINGFTNNSQCTATVLASTNWTVGQEFGVEGFGTDGFIVQFVGSQVCYSLGGIATSAAGTVTTSDLGNTTSAVSGCRIIFRYVATDTFWATQMTGEFQFA